MLDIRSVAIGAAVAVVLIVPTMVVLRALDDDSSSGLGTVYLLVVVAAIAIGAAVAGRRQRATPLMHGAAVGLVAFVLAQLVASLLDGELPNVFGFAFFALAFTCLGAIGGLLGTARLLEDGPRQRGADGDDSPGAPGSRERPGEEP